MQYTAGTCACGMAVKAGLFSNVPDLHWNGRVATCCQNSVFLQSRYPEPLVPCSNSDNSFGMKFGVPHFKKFPSELHVQPLTAVPVRYIYHERQLGGLCGALEGLQISWSYKTPDPTCCSRFRSQVCIVSTTSCRLDHDEITIETCTIETGNDGRKKSTPAIPINHFWHPF